MNLKQTKKYNITFIEDEEHCRINGIKGEDFYRIYGLDIDVELIYDKDCNYVIYDNTCYSNLDENELVKLVFKENYVDTTIYMGSIYESKESNYKYELDLDQLIWFKNLTFQPFRFIYRIGIDIQTLFNIEMSLNQYYKNKL